MYPSKLENLVKTYSINTAIEDHDNLRNVQKRTNKRLLAKQPHTLYQYKYLRVLRANPHYNY